MTRGIGGIRVGRNSQNYSWPKCFKWSFPENYQLYHFASQNPNYEQCSKLNCKHFRIPLPKYKHEGYNWNPEILSTVLRSKNHDRSESRAKTRVVYYELIRNIKSLRNSINHKDCDNQKQNEKYDASCEPAIPSLWKWFHIVIICWRSRTILSLAQGPVVVELLR